MGLIDFNTPVCPAHGRVFTEISVCGVMIKCCEDCTRPARTFKKKKCLSFKKELTNYTRKQKASILKEAWKDRTVLYRRPKSARLKKGISNNRSFGSPS